MSGEADETGDAAPCINGALGDTERTHYTRPNSDNRAGCSSVAHSSVCTTDYRAQAHISAAPILNHRPAPMASYLATQLKDMFFVLVERVTGYGWGEDQDAAGAKESKMTSADQVSRTDEEEVAVVQNIQIRARSGDPFVSGGSKPQVD